MKSQKRKSPWIRVKSNRQTNTQDKTNQGLKAPKRGTPRRDGEVAGPLEEFQGSMDLR